MPVIHFLSQVFVAAAVIALVLPAGAARAGVTNPNISVIGTLHAEMSDDRADPDYNRPRLTFDEAEAQFDDYLNPYARGTVVLSAGEEFELEEAYFEIVRGLPAGLGLKAGKYRVDFGRLNPQHPHAYPFIDKPAVLGAYLPGDEAFNETGVSVSKLFAMPRDVASTLSLDVLQGISYRYPNATSDQTRLAWNARLRNFLMVGARSSLEVGMSASAGTMDPSIGTKRSLFGLDGKAKLYASPRSFFVFQGEWIMPAIDDTSGGGKSTSKPSGGWFSADYNHQARWYGGLKAENYQEVAADKPTTTRFGAYAGLLLLEESTVFGLLAENVKPDGGESYNRFILQAIFSMGPHKPHQF
jgi:hypothetical protein